MPGRSIVAGTHTREHFASTVLPNIMAFTQGTFRETVLDVVANDRRGVVLARHEFERMGRGRSYDTAHVHRIEAGCLAAFKGYPEDLYAFDAERS